MPRFALKYPFFIIMLCMVVAVVGITTVVRMPVDLFPQIKIPVVVVATFYAGMPPEQVERNSDRLARLLDQAPRQSFDNPIDLRSVGPMSAEAAGDPSLRTTKNLIWLRVPDMKTYAKVEEALSNSPSFRIPAIKCETASSGIGSFLEAYRDMLWGMRWLLVPAVLATMSLVIANAISISVRERRPEMAVLKVLGFRPAQIMLLVLGLSLARQVTTANRTAVGMVSWYWHFVDGVWVVVFTVVYLVGR